MTALRMLTSPSSLTLLAAATLGYAGYSIFFSRKQSLPPPGPRKLDPVQLDKMHDRALEDSMAASDPPSTMMPEVRN